MIRSSAKTGAALVVALLVGALMAGCQSASAGATTCSKFSELSFNDQGNLITKMIREHGLDPSSNAGGVITVEMQVAQFCGMPGGGSGGKATKNSSSPIEDGVDWKGVTAK